MGGGRLSRRSFLVGAAAGGLASAIAADAMAAGSGPAFPSGGGATAHRSAVRLAPPASPASPSGWIIGSIGHSVEGRPIELWHTQPSGATRHVVIVCGIHGDERAAFTLADAFSRIERPGDIALTIVPIANPDGWAAGERRNVRKVDLNRNFPVSWLRSDHSGSTPASEPETRSLMWLLGTTRPNLTIWVHQPLGYVAGLSTCPDEYVDAWAAATGSPVRRRLFQWGGGETWTAERLRLPSLLVEVEGDEPAPTTTAAHANALAATLAAVAVRP